MMSHTQKVSICAAVMMSAGAALGGIAQSTFDNDAEGWSFLNDARNFEWSSSEGNPPGAIRATDRGTGAIWFYSASSAFLGDQSASYGGTLSWEILGRVGNQTSIPSQADVMLAGAGMFIGIDSGIQPLLGTWVGSSVEISDAQDWRLISSSSSGGLSGTSATAADIQAVLADLTGLYIRGEYTNGADSTALDNVVLVPAPGAGVVLCGLGVLASRRRR